MKVFISQLMNGMSDDEILKKREELRATLKKELEGRGIKNIEFSDTWCKVEPPIGVNIPVWYLADSIKRIAESDYAYFEDGWCGHAGCRIEHKICLEYNIPILKLIK